MTEENGGTRKIRAEEDSMVSIKQSEFDKKIQPKKINDPKELFFFKCSNCKGIHFRHAGYVEIVMPYIRGDQEKRVTADSYDVKVCVKCKHSFVWYGDQMYDISDLIDLEAWEKTEEECHKATGPGGNC